MITQPPLRHERSRHSQWTFLVLRSPILMTAAIISLKKNMSMVTSCVSLIDCKLVTVTHVNSNIKLLVTDGEILLDVNLYRKLGEILLDVLNSHPSVHFLCCAPRQSVCVFPMLCSLCYCFLHPTLRSKWHTFFVGFSSLHQPMIQNNVPILMLISQETSLIVFPPLNITSCQGMY